MALFTISLFHNQTKSDKNLDSDWLGAIQEAITTAKSVASPKASDKVLVYGFFSDVGKDGGMAKFRSFELTCTGNGNWI